MMIILVGTAACFLLLNWLAREDQRDRDRRERVDRMFDRIDYLNALYRQR